MNFVLSQDTKSLQGKIIDSKSKEPLIGANVIIKGTAQGSATNVDGEFYISDIVQSMVNLQVSYIGYKTKTISDIELKDGLNSEIVIELNADVISVTEVKVQAERKVGGQAEALAKKQDALELQDNISSDQISKSGDSHVADAVRRVTGVTIMNDKFLVVRGLGDRYSSAQLNSVGMPSPESDRRSVPLDLFSTSLISGIDVAKSYRPDLPGAFGGGNVNIRTKLYPSKTIYKIKFGTGVSGNLMPGDNVQKNTSGNADFLGFDRGQLRDLPSTFDSELISYSSIPNDFMPELMTPITSTFTGDTIGWNSDPAREFLWFKQSYEKNNLLPNPFQNSQGTANLPTNLSVTYGTKYGEKSNVEMGFLFDGSFSGKSKYNQERMDRYNAYNDPNDEGTVTINPNTGDSSVTYNKLLRPGFIGLDLSLIHI